jgi:hypothetical protein
MTRAFQLVVPKMLVRVMPLLKENGHAEGALLISSGRARFVLQEEPAWRYWTASVKVVVRVAPMLSMPVIVTAPDPTKADEAAEIFSVELPPTGPI